MVPITLLINNDILNSLQYKPNINSFNQENDIDLSLKLSNIIRSTDFKKLYALFTYHQEALVNKSVLDTKEEEILEKVRNSIKNMMTPSENNEAQQADNNQIKKVYKDFLLMIRLLDPENPHILGIIGVINIILIKKMGANAANDVLKVLSKKNSASKVKNTLESFALHSGISIEPDIIEFSTQSSRLKEKCQQLGLGNEAHYLIQTMSNLNDTSDNKQAHHRQMSCLLKNLNMAIDTDKKSKLIDIVENLKANRKNYMKQYLEGKYHKHITNKAVLFIYNSFNLALLKAIQVPQAPLLSESCRNSGKVFVHNSIITLKILYDSNNSATSIDLFFFRKRSDNLKEFTTVSKHFIKKLTKEKSAQFKEKKTGDKKCKQNHFNLFGSKLKSNHREYAENSGVMPQPQYHNH